MAGTTAYMISKKMNLTISMIQRDLTSMDAGLSSFYGYLDALSDLGVIDSGEHQMFSREVARLVTGEMSYEK